MTIDTAKEREYLKSQHGVEGYRYRFADPISGRPVWRCSPGPWNGQRPREAGALYTHSVYLTASAALDVIDAQAAEIERLRGACNQSRLAFAGYVSPQSAIDALDNAALSEREP